MTGNRATTKVVREGDWRTEEHLVIKNPPGKMKKSHKAVSAQILASGYTKGTCWIFTTACDHRVCHSLRQADVYKREIGRFVERGLITSIICSTFLKICSIGRLNRLINDINQMDYSFELKTGVPFAHRDRLVFSQNEYSVKSRSAGVRVSHARGERVFTLALGLLSTACAFLAYAKSLTVQQSTSNITETGCPSDFSNCPVIMSFWGL